MARRTLAATRAAAAEHAELALEVCLQQPAFCRPDDRMLITLLAVSKWLAALVAAHWRGRLVMSTHVYAQYEAYALAAWLSRHGALLAELELIMDTDGTDWRTAVADAASRQKLHPLAQLLAQLPRNLMRLVLKGFSGSHDDAAAQAAADAFAAVCSRQPMQLRSLELPHIWASSAGHNLAMALPGLAALSQLTSLVMPLPGDASQLPMQHLPAQLQQLEVVNINDDDCAWSMSSACPWLALEHVTGLTSLCMWGIVVDGGTLPRGLRALTVGSVSDLAPMLQLQQLTVLESVHCSAPAEQLRQLSTLQRLEQLCIGESPCHPSVFSEMAATLSALPLKRLGACGQALTPACLDHLGACTRLTRLQLKWCSLAPGATLEQLAAMLGRLTALERFEAGYMQLQSAAGDADWAHVCQALARLPRLAACNLSNAKLGPAAGSQLAAATQLTELHVAGCWLDTASVLALCSSLTGMRCLDVSDNSLGDGCLEGIGALCQLTWLRISGMGVTEAGLQQLQAAQPDLHLQQRRYWW